MQSAPGFFQFQAAWANFEPVSGGCDVKHAGEAGGEVVVSRGDGAVDLEVAGRALNRSYIFKISGLDGSVLAAESQPTCKDSSMHNDKRSVLTCTPHSVFSWSYDVSGLPSGLARLALTMPGSDGSILLENGGSALVVREIVRLFGNRWYLESNGQVLADAKKPGFFKRTLEVSFADRKLQLRPQLPIIRAFDIIDGELAIGVIEPAHPLTRHATVQCPDSIPEAIRLFCFWLIVESWRGSDNNPV